MKNKKLEANLSMAVSKIFSGLNMNALKYLLPLWMSPLTGATLRCTFAAVAFWVIGWFMPPEKSSTKDKWLLFLLGAFGLYGFMFLYLAGLSKTTPVSSSIFTSLQPIWVFLIMIFFYKEKATWKKILGISICIRVVIITITFLFKGKDISLWAVVLLFTRKCRLSAAILINILWENNYNVPFPAATRPVFSLPSCSNIIRY